MGSLLPSHRRAALWSKESKLLLPHKYVETLLTERQQAQEKSGSLVSVQEAKLPLPHLAPSEILPRRLKPQQSPEKGAWCPAVTDLLVAPLRAPSAQSMETAHVQCLRACDQPIKAQRFPTLPDQREEDPASVAPHGCPGNSGAHRIMAGSHPSLPRRLRPCAAL